MYETQNPKTTFTLVYSGDIVYAKKLEKPDYLKVNDVCAIATTKQEALMKRVKEKRYDKKTGKLIYLILLSDNVQVYPKEREINKSAILFWNT